MYIHIPPPLSPRPCPPQAPRTGPRTAPGPTASAGPHVADGDSQASRTAPGAMEAAVAFMIRALHPQAPRPVARNQYNTSQIGYPLQYSYIHYVHMYLYYTHMLYRSKVGHLMH